MEGVGLSGFWHGKRVLVTGATGLIGSWLVRSLLDEHADVVALVRDWDPQSELIRSNTVLRTSVVNGSIESFDTIARAVNEHEVDTVFHLGAQTIVGAAYRAPLATFEANIRGTYNLLEACRQSRSVQRVIVASSDKAYGDATELPYTEVMPVVGRHPYDVSKSCTDLLAQSYFHTYGLPVAVARCGNVYGGGDLNWSRIVPGTIRSLGQGERPVIRSDGTFTRDYVYVQDVVAAYLGLGERLDRAEVRGEAFNFAPERPRSVLEIVADLRRLMRREELEPVILNSQKAEIRHQYLSAEKANRLLEWKPRYSLDEGLSETIGWYQQFFGKLN